MTETFRLADQIRRAFEGNAWHGDSILELLAGVMPGRPPPGRSKMRTASGNFCCTSPPGTMPCAAELGAQP